MSVTSGFFNSLSGDRKYDAIQISSMFDGLITDGIYNGFLESFMVTASSPASMVVTVGEGRCWFNHTWTLNDAPFPLTLDAGDVALNRIDTIVIDVDSTDTVRACTIKVIKGTPSSQAVRPTLENTEAHHQYPLCDISVPAGATTITQSNITNRRGTSDCPFVATLMESVDVDDLLIQWESQWNDWMTDRANAMDSWTAEQQEAFTTWFQTVQDILDQDTAGNLLNRINHRTGINATATYSAGVVAITAPDDAGEILTFVAPSDFLSSDTYTLNGEALTITDLNGEALDDSWKKDSPVTITVSGGKAFFKAGGSGKNDTLPPLLGNMTVEVVEGDENDTYTIKMDKLILDKTTEMVGGAQLEWGEEMPAKPGKGTGGIKTWTREEIITTGKPYDGLYLGDVTPSDAVTKTLIYLPENDSGSVKLVPFIVLSVDYLGGVYVMRQKGNKDWVGKYGNNVTYENSTADTWLTSYLNSVLDKSIADKVLECEIHVFEQGTIKRKCWIPSYGELYSDFTDSGNTFMPYFNSNGRRALIKQDDGNPLSYWTRTFYNLSNVRMINPDGSGYFQSASNKTAAYRPAFVLPKDFKIQQRPDGSYTVWNEQGLMTLGDIEVSTADKAVEFNIPIVSRSDSSINNKKYAFVAKEYLGTKAGILTNIDGNFETATMNAEAYNTAPAYIKLNDFKNGTGSTITYLHEKIRAALKSIPIKYRNRTGSILESSESCFLLSAADAGLERDWTSQVGATFPYYTTAINRIIKDGFGRPTSGWLRDMDATTTAFFLATAGNVASTAVNSNMVLNPSLSFDLTAPIRQLADGTYDLVPEDPALSGATKSISVMAETSGTPIQLKDIPVSTAGSKVTVKIPETGGEQIYFTLRENYDGVSGGYALMRDNTAPGTRFHATPVNTDKPYQNSELDTHVQNFANNLNESVRKYLVEGSVLIGVSGSQVTLKRSIFLPSVKEVGYTFTSVYPEGTPFEYFDSDNSRKSDNDYWTRSRDMSSGSGKADYISLSQGGLESASQTSTKPIRPIILVSGEAWFLDNGDGTYTFVGDEPVPDNPQVTHTVEVPHGQKVVFRQFTQNQKKQFQTMLVGGVYPPLGDVEPPFKLPEFTGNHAIFGDETAGRIELYESGDLTLSPGTYDFFLVGGGSGSSYDFNDYNNSSSSTGTSGGGAGYTLTIKDYAINSSYPIPVIVGGPSVSSAKLPEGSELPRTTFAGNPTSIGIADKTYVAEGGKVTRNGNGSNRMANIGYDGGSGGSSKNAGPGGSDGSNGSGTTGGLGQGTTTRAFEDSDGTLYAGGGGGFQTLGGPGGGGNGATTTTESAGTPGTPNTGGGAGGSYRRFGGMAAVAAGGSGIVIVRWNNA